jgi:predicted metallo-beta-lactamase superfamily hydrolase
MVMVVSAAGTMLVCMPAVMVVTGPMTYVLTAHVLSPE